MDRPGHAARRGQVLVEFAIIAVVLYLLLGAIISFGQMLHAAQVTQQTADFTARELARTPLPAEATFEQVRDDLEGPFRDRIFSEDWLVLDLTPFLADTQGRSLYQYLQEDLSIPPANLMLVPLMGVRRIGDQTYLAYPGALVESDTAPSGYSVQVPLVVSRADEGGETIRWVRVLEEIDTEETADGDEGTNPDPFSLASAGNGRPGGLVALRLNFPFQSSTLLASRTGRAEDRIRANDADVSAVNQLEIGSLAETEETAGPNAGPFGLGRQLAYGEEVRPFRRVLAAQSIHRREVFE